MNSKGKEVAMSNEIIPVDTPSPTPIQAMNSKGKVVATSNESNAIVDPPSPPPVPNVELDCCNESCYTKLLMDNYSNFKQTGSPVQFMHYEAGSWVDFTDEVAELLRSGFKEGNSVIEVEIGGIRFLFDLYRMIQIKLVSEKRRSIAWVDVDGKCFYPKAFVNGEEESLERDLNIEILNVTENLADQKGKIEIELRIGGNSNSSKRKRDDVENEKIEGGLKLLEGSIWNEIVAAIEGEGSKRGKNLEVRSCSKVGPTRWPKTRLVEEGERNYLKVKELFLSGMGIPESGVTITAINQCVCHDPLVRARFTFFLKQVEVTKATRGDANLVFGWHGTSAERVASILTYGFGMPSKFSLSQPHGIGVYLSHLSRTSAMLAEVDKYGEKHVILCRVILGKCEKIEAGSQQLCPSGVDFDTGVDELENPKWYVVWCAHVNTHILPEFVVSYKSPGLVAGTSNLVQKHSRMEKGIKILG